MGPVIRAIPTADRAVLEQSVRRLKLRRVREMLDDVNKLALHGEPSHVELLAYIASQEIESPGDTERAKRLRSARCSYYKTLDDFGFTSRDAIGRQQMRDQAQLRFIEEHQNFILLRHAGVGKTHVAVPLGTEAVTSGYRVLFTTAEGLMWPPLQRSCRWRGGPAG